jgi:hypothetical protein
MYILWILTSPHWPGRVFDPLELLHYMYRVIPLPLGWHNISFLCSIPYQIVKNDEQAENIRDIVIAQWLHWTVA